MTRTKKWLEGPVGQSDSKWSLSCEKMQGEGAVVGKEGRALRGLMFDLVLFNIFINDPEEG